AVWASWIERRPLQFKGRYFTLSLMTPFFTPPEPPPAALRIEVAGVGGRMCRLAGEVADGFHVHAFHTRRYLREVVMPQIQAGLDRSGRGRDAFSVSAGVFAAIGTEADVAAGLQEIRRHFAFYASTPTYRPVLNLHGWGEVGEQLSRHAARGEWEAMPGLITDEMMEAAALWGPPDEVADRLLAEYRGLVDRVAIYERVGVYEFTVSARREGVYRTLLDRVRAGSQRAG
ncbi:MAG: LLM class flavin-dependent oxidoreductase, partial [Armatimonadetes bacterium]|nr:LLM class flavin-dependent oxidoreductase [Armatimonadota bacterium]